MLRFPRPVRAALLCWALAGLGIGLGACRRPSEPAIGYAMGIRDTTIVRLIQAALADSAAGPLRLALDTASRGGAPEDHVARAEWLVGVPGLQAVVGHDGSRASLATAPVYNKAGRVQLVPFATSRLLHGAGDWTFMLSPDDSVEGAFLGRYAVERLRAARVTIFYVRDEYGKGLRDGALAELARRGVTVVDEVPFLATSDLPLLVEASLRRARPDLLVVAGLQQATGAIARAAQAVIPGMRVLAGDGALVLPELAEAAGPAADSIYAVSFWQPDAPDSVSRAFVARFRAETGRDPQPPEALEYDAALLLATAVREVGPDPAAIRRWLRALGVTRQPYRGVTGDITFRPDRPARLIMVRLSGGRAVRAFR